MNKKNDFDLFNDDSLWGNQTAGGLSNDDILKTNWNKKHTSATKQLLIKTSKQAIKNKSETELNEWRNNQKKSALVAQKKRRVYIKTPDGIMHGLLETCKFYKITTGSLMDRIRYNPNEYFYCDEAGNKVTSNRKIKDTSAYKEAAKRRQKSVHTPAGVFNSLKDACMHYGLAAVTIREKIKSNNIIHKNWYYLDK